jgi:hypothetical protein
MEIPSHLAQRQTPEERELDKKKAELAILETTLAERELDLATLQGELRAFEARYLRTMGSLYSELDDLHARLAEAQARRHPRDREFRTHAEASRAKAEASAHAIEDALTSKRNEFIPDDNLRKLYREVARRIHPDLSTNDVERRRRTTLMADANRAYAEGNEDELRKILDDWQSSPESVDGEGTAAELVRTIRKIHQVEQRLANISTEIQRLTSSELYDLKRQVEGAHERGRDLLAEMAGQLLEELEPLRSRTRTEATSHE